MPTNILDVGKSGSFMSDDRIFLGEGLFETIRVDQRRPCYSLFHWQRMRQAAISLGISFDLSSEEWYEHLVHCIQVANIRVDGIKVILSGGRARRALDARSDSTSIVFEAFTYQYNQQALRLVSAGWLRDATNPIYQLKSVNYLESILARRQALACGADDALFFNLEHYATETTVANLFVVKNNEIFTPQLTNGVLAGTIRGRLLSLSAESGIICNEMKIDGAAIADADAIFVTNALQGIRSVISFDGAHVPIQHPLVTILRQVLATDCMRLDY